VNRLTLTQRQGPWAVAAWWAGDEEWKISVRGVKNTLCARSSRVEDMPLPWGFACFVPFFPHLCPLAPQQIWFPSSSCSDCYYCYKTFNSSNSSLIPRSPHTLIPFLYQLLSMSLNCDLDRRQHILCYIQL